MRNEQGIQKIITGDVKFTWWQIKTLASELKENALFEMLSIINDSIDLNNFIGSYPDGDYNGLNKAALRAGIVGAKNPAPQPIDVKTNNDPTHYLDPFPAENQKALTFANFTATQEHRLLKESAEEILAAIIANKPRTITFIAGTPGCGKTQIAAVLAQAVRDAGYSTAFLRQGGSREPGWLVCELTKSQTAIPVKLIVIDDLELPKLGEKYYIINTDPKTKKKSMSLFSGLQKLLSYCENKESQLIHTHLLFTSNVDNNPSKIFSAERIQNDIAILKGQEIDFSQLEKLKTLLSQSSMKFLYVKAPSLRCGLADHMKLKKSVHPVQALIDPSFPSGVLLVSSSVEYDALERALPLNEGIQKLTKTDENGMVSTSIAEKKIWGLTYNEKELARIAGIALIIRAVWEKGHKLIIVTNQTYVEFITALSKAFDFTNQLNTGKTDGFNGRLSAMTVTLLNPGFCSVHTPYSAPAPLTMPVLDTTDMIQITCKDLMMHSITISVTRGITAGDCIKILDEYQKNRQMGMHLDPDKIRVFYKRALLSSKSVFTENSIINIVLMLSGDPKQQIPFSKQPIVVLQPSQPYATTTTTPTTPSFFKKVCSTLFGQKPKRPDENPEKPSPK